VFSVAFLFFNDTVSAKQVIKQVVNFLSGDAYQKNYSVRASVFTVMQEFIGIVKDEALERALLPIALKECDSEVASKVPNFKIHAAECFGAVVACNGFSRQAIRDVKEKLEELRRDTDMDVILTAEAALAGLH